MPKNPYSIASAAELHSRIPAIVSILGLSGSHRINQLEQRLLQSLDCALISSTLGQAGTAASRARTFKSIETWGRRLWESTQHEGPVQRRAEPSRLSRRLAMAIGSQQVSTVRGSERRPERMLLDFALALQICPKRPDRVLPEAAAAIDDAIRRIRAVGRTADAQRFAQRVDLSGLEEAAALIADLARRCRETDEAAQPVEHRVRYPAKQAAQLILADLLHVYQEFSRRRIATSVTHGVADGPLIQFLELTLPLVGHRPARDAIRARVRSLPPEYLPRYPVAKSIR